MCEMITKSGTSCKEDHREVMQEKGHVKKKDGRCIETRKAPTRRQYTMWKDSCNRGIRNVGLKVEDRPDRTK